MRHGLIAIALFLARLLAGLPAVAGTPEVTARMSVLVLPCESSPQLVEQAHLADDLLVKSLVEQRRFRVIEREKLEQVLAEQQLSRTKLTDAGHSLRLGRLAGADSILASTLREEGTTLVATARIFTTETSAELAFTATTAAAGLPGLKELTRELASRLAQAFPRVEGTVLRSGNGTVVAAIGSASRVRAGMKAIVYRPGKELKHPVTGRSLGQESTELAEGTIAEVRPDSSLIRLAKPETAARIVPGDRVTTK